MGKSPYPLQAALQSSLPRQLHAALPGSSCSIGLPAAQCSAGLRAKEQDEFYEAYLGMGPKAKKEEEGRKENQQSSHCLIVKLR